MSSTTTLVVGVVVSFLWALLGYRLAERDRRVLGRSPWGWPPLAWAVLWLLTPLIGGPVFLVAHWIERRSPHRLGPSDPATGPWNPAVSTMAGPTVPPSGTSASDLFPAYPRPANGQVSEGEPHPPAPAPAPVTAPPAPVQAAAPPSQAAAPPSWQVDPSGRFQYRWWTGAEWTSHVATDGHVLVDTNPDQRIGPY